MGGVTLGNVVVPRWRRAAALGALAGIAFGCIVASLLSLGWDPTTDGGDAWTYLAAGERLNAGHRLYALVAGDRPVRIVPPYWTVPLVAPPPIAVVWRPLALLGDNAMFFWALAVLISTITAVALLARSWSGIGLVALFAAPLALVGLSGNASGFILLGLIAAWTTRDRPLLVGLLIAAMAAVKLTPLLLIAWLLATQRWRAIAWSAAVGGIILGASIAGAGTDAWLAWVANVPQSAPSPIALSTMTGSPPLVIFGLAGLSVLVTFVVTRSDSATFAVAVVGAALTTPALYFQAIALIAACAAPRLRTVHLHIRPVPAPAEK